MVVLILAQLVWAMQECIKVIYFRRDFIPKAFENNKQIYHHDSASERVYAWPGLQVPTRSQAETESRIVITLLQSIIMLSLIPLFILNQQAGGEKCTQNPTKHHPGQWDSISNSVQRNVTPVEDVVRYNAHRGCSPSTRSQRAEQYSILWSPRTLPCSGHAHLISQIERPGTIIWCIQCSQRRHWIPQSYSDVASDL